MPENGKSLFHYPPAEQSGQMRTDAVQNGEGYKVTPIPAAAFAVNAKDAAWVDAMCVKQPLATFEQKPALSGLQLPNCVYILAAGWGPSPFQQFGSRFKDDRGWQFVSVACGHDVMVTCRRNSPPRSSPPLRGKAASKPQLVDQPIIGRTKGLTRRPGRWSRKSSVKSEGNARRTASECDPMTPCFGTVRPFEALQDHVSNRGWTGPVVDIEETTRMSRKRH